MRTEGIWNNQEDIYADFAVFKQENPYHYNTEQFSHIEKDITNPKKNTTSDESIDFIAWKTGGATRAESVLEFLKMHGIIQKGMKVLEVGSGRCGALSNLLVEHGCVVTSMDGQLEKQFYTPGIQTMKADFTHEVDVTEYDIVIGQEPCDATEHIIRACNKTGTAYIIFLCGTPHAYLESGEMPKDVFEWYDYLAELSGDKENLRYERVYPGYVMGVLSNISYCKIL